MNEASARARNCMQAFAERMKRNADAKRREIQFEVEDQVLLRTRHLNLAVAGAAKLKPRLVGAFELFIKNGTVAYKLNWPLTLSKLHP